MRGALVTSLIAAAAAVVSLAGVAAADDTPSPNTQLTPSGRQLDPAGRMTQVGAFPTGGALSPDGRFYWTVDSGRGATAVRVGELATGAGTQVLPTPGGPGGSAA